MRLRSRDFSFLFAVGLCGCAEHAPPIDTHPAAPTPNATDASAPPTIQLLIPIEAGVDSGSDAPTAPEKVAVEAAEWLTARGIPASQHGKLDSAFRCEELVVGTSHEPALVCTVMEDVTRKSRKTTMDRMLAHRTVNVVRSVAGAQTIVKVLDVVVSVEALDKANPRAANILDLGLHFAQDGSTAMLDETTDLPHVHCAEAKAHIHDVLTNPDSLPYREWPRFDLQLIQSACGSLGVWEWQKDHFVRGARKPADK